MEGYAFLQTSTPYNSYTRPNTQNKKCLLAKVFCLINTPSYMPKTVA